MKPFRTTCALSLLLAACSSSSSDPNGLPDAPEADTAQSFFAIPKAEATGALATRALPPASTATDAVYLVVNKKELDHRFFLSAFLEKLSPGGVGVAAAATLGTRVVTMRVQNDKLYFFDAGESKAASKVGDQELVIDAYPTVDVATLGAKYAALYPKKDWVVIDPGVSQNPYTFVKDLFGAGGVPFETQLSYQQRFQSLADGVQFQQVFSGYASQALFDGTVDPNQLHVEGTITLSLRKYVEGAGFAAAPEVTAPHYFTNGTSYGTTLTGTDATNKWNIKPGMKPLKWLISRNVLDTIAASGNAYDLVSAIKKGIEGWNAVFGFKVLEAQLAGPNDRIGDDTVNFLEWDTDPALPFAFANWRANPNTGEIRGASVYVSSVFFDPTLFEDDPAPGSTSTARAFLKTYGKRPMVPAVAWGGMQAHPGCSLFVGDALGSAARAKLFGGPKTASTLTKKEKVELFIQHVVLHEIGHTLGLRHNFKGSLVPPGTDSTSVMDYLLDAESVARSTPGPYDVDAVKYLYGMSTTEPAQAFCTDDDVSVDPDCNTFDKGDDPLHQYYGPYQQHLYDLVFTGANTIDDIGPYISYATNDLADYVRAGSATQANDAVGFLYTGTQAGWGTAPNANAAAVDFIDQLVTKRLYLDPPSAEGDIKGPPKADVAPSTLKQLAGVLTNVDSIRTYPARRQAVDVLKSMQTDDALKTLLDARATLAAAAASATGSDKC